MEITSTPDLFSRNSFNVDSSQFSSGLSDFDIAQTVRLMKLIRFVKVVKVNQIFKLRKLIYRVSILILFKLLFSSNGSSSMIISVSQ